MIEKHIITYPGFAEGLSAKGLYEEIKVAYSSRYTFHLLPFYEEDESTGDRTVYSIERHKDILQTHMDSLDGEITILGKCGGSRVVTALDDDHLARVEKMALFNPPWAISRSRLEARFEGWKGSRQNDGSWHIPRKGGAKYIITPDYIREASSMRPIDNYRRIAQKTRLFIVRGMNDEVIRPVIDVTRIGDNVESIDIEGGDHHLTHPWRERVIYELGSRGVL